MVMPLISSALNIASSLHGLSASETDSHKGRTLAYAGAIGVGALGTGFHIYNVSNRVGGFRWENFFYGAPARSPGRACPFGHGRARGRPPGRQRQAASTARPTLFGMPAGRVLAALTSLGLLGTMGEAGLLHFRGNFQNPAMYLPVTLPPIAAAVMAEAALRPSRRKRRSARVWLGLTSVLGIAGVGFHCYGVSRAMGGWKNWRQNVVDGPPIPAPPSFRWPGPRRHRGADADRKGRAMIDRFPGYDVLKKRNTLSWNEPTRQVIDKRLAVHPGPRFFSMRRNGRPSARSAPASCRSRGTGPLSRCPPMSTRRCSTTRSTATASPSSCRRGQAWKAALAAVDAQARDRHGSAFHLLPALEQDALLEQMQKGELEGAFVAKTCPSDLFFSKRVLHDIVGAYYAHPHRLETRSAGAGPASPRGFVRLDKNIARPMGSRRGPSRRGREGPQGERSCRLYTPVDDPMTTTPRQARTGA